MGILDAHADKWQPEPNSGCLLWTGSLRGVNRDPRPSARHGGKVVFVARAVLSEKLGRELNADEVTRHTCNTGICVNSDHLIPGSHRDNKMDMAPEARRAGSLKAAAVQGYDKRREAAKKGYLTRLARRVL